MNMLQLFEAQQEYFDIPASKLTAVQIREKLAKLSATVLDEEQAAKVNDLLLLKSTPNGGTAVTEELKYMSCVLHPRVEPLLNDSHSQIF